MDPRTFQFDLPKRGRPRDAVFTEVWYPGIARQWERCTSPRSVDPIFGIRAVVIHATAGSTSAGAISVLTRADQPASFHWLVPAAHEPQHGHLVWACAPEARAAWHVRNAAAHPDVCAGANRVNHWSLGIELVNTQRDEPFSDWQVAITARIVRYCWAKYPNLRHVVAHAKLDPARREDPGPLFPWDRFVALVRKGAPDELPPAAETRRFKLPATRAGAATASPARRNHVPAGDARRRLRPGRDR